MLSHGIPRPPMGKLLLNHAVLLLLVLGRGKLLVQAAPLGPFPLLHDLLDGGDSLVGQTLVLENCPALARVPGYPPAVRKE